MAILHLVEGPVGAGKSTFAKALSSSLRAPHLDLDQWLRTLFSPDRPSDGFVQWYSERKARCIRQIWDVACEILDSGGTSVILELGLVTRADREAFYRRVDATDYTLRIYLLDTPLERRRQHVRERNRQKAGSYKMEVSEEIFELANSFWEEPTQAERRERNVEIVTLV